jgi:2-phosphosulfolactate phosphatase
MRIERCTLSEVSAARGAVVVIDVLRSFSTAAYALAAGARAVIPARDEAQAQALRARHAPALTVGAAPGGVPLLGFDLLNSPSALIGQPLAGVNVVQLTAGGVRALLDAPHAAAVFAASLAVARATARAVAALAPLQVTLVTTGAWEDRDGDEDLACADLIEGYLRGLLPEPAPYAQRVRDSDFGRRFGSAPHLPLADLALCAAPNRFDFAMPLVRRDDGSVLLVAAAA